MIAALIRWCVGNRVLLVLLTAALVGVGTWSALNVTVDAIPDLSDVQVVIRTEYPGQAPQIVEDQVTYPLTTAMLSVPHASVVRGFSMFGSSFVYVIFEDGTDMYWARSRVLESLSFVGGKLPAGVTPQLGPDATGVGWVYEYVLVTEPGSGVDLARLRGLQDWYLRYGLTAVDGVSEVATVGGFVKQYQVVVDPVKLLAFGVSLEQVKSAIERSNADSGGSVLELGETEFMVRGLGYLGTPGARDLEEARRTGEPIDRVRTAKVVEELRKVSLGATPRGSAIHLSDVGEVHVGPQMRSGLADWNGQGETVGGVVVMRSGENARDTIARVKEKLASLEKGLPPGVSIEPAYDRSDLIDRAVGTLQRTLLEEILVVSLICVLFLLHARSALVAAFVLPTGVLATLALMKLVGINANIMSLGGIAIAIGVMVDSSIIMVENAHKHLELERRRRDRGERPRPRSEVITEAAVEVGPSLFFALLIIVVSFLPIFVLGEQSGRLFRPLAWTKTFAMAAGALLAVTIIPVLMVFFVTERVLPDSWSRRRQMALLAAVIAVPALLLVTLPLGPLGPYRLWLAAAWAVLSALVILPQRIPTERQNPLSRFLEAVYDPLFTFVMRYRALTLVAAAALVAASVYPLQRLGSEFMPPLEEGDLLYMPTTDPGIGMGKVRELLQQTDALIKQFPEVESVLGKAGRAETATDPAPPSMFETTITLHRDRERWRHTVVPRFFSGWPGPLKAPLALVWPETRPITVQELVHGYSLPGAGRPVHVPGLDEVLQIPGLTNSWTMPIRTRIDMLSTGIKTPVGVKVMGPDLETLAAVGERIARTIRTDARTGPHTLSAFPEKSVGGNYLDVRIDRDAIARHGLLVADVQDVITSAVGGMNVGSTVEGLERYPINVRYPRELREDLPRLRQTLVATPGGAQVPLAQLASFEIHKGPPEVKSENGQLTSWVYVDIAGIDVGTFVKDAQAAVARGVTLPPGTTLVWSGQYEYMLAAQERLKVAVPLALLAIVLLLYLATRSWLRVGIVLLAVPFSLVGAVWLLYLMGYHLSLAVAVGAIALAGLDAETGLVMLLYLESSFDRFRSEGRMRDENDLWHAIHDGAVKRIRPKTMTVVSTGVGLVPLLWAQGAGADTMRRLAVPMIGGLATSFLLELLIYPVLFYLVKRASLRREPVRELRAA